MVGAELGVCGTALVPALLEAIAVAVRLQDVNVVGEALLRWKCQDDEFGDVPRLRDFRWAGLLVIVVVTMLFQCVRRAFAVARMDAQGPPDAGHQVSAEESFGKARIEWFAALGSRASLRQYRLEQIVPR